MKEAIQELEMLSSHAADLSQAAAGRDGLGWTGKHASLVFAKICITSLSFLRLVPGSKAFSSVGGLDLWDLSSAASLARNIIEAYNVLFYLVGDKVPEEETEFRRALWEYHEAWEQHEILKNSLADSPNLPKIAAKLLVRRQTLELSSYFQTLSSGYRNELLDGKTFLRRSHVDISGWAGISEKFYRSEFKYCSNFAHTAPFSISALDDFAAGTPKAEQVLRVLVRVVSGYVALAIRDYLPLFPDLVATFPQEVTKTIKVKEEMMKWEKSPFFAKSPESSK